MCKSSRTMRFLDGFGDKRVFCRGCGRSFLENVFVKLSQQRRLEEFKQNLNYKEMVR